MDEGGLIYACIDGWLDGLIDEDGWANMYGWMDV